MQHSSNDTHPTAPEVSWNREIIGARPSLQDVRSIRTKPQISAVRYLGIEVDHALAMAE